MRRMRDHMIGIWHTHTLALAISITMSNIDIVRQIHFSWTTRTANYYAYEHVYYIVVAT